MKRVLFGFMALTVSALSACSGAPVDENEIETDEVSSPLEISGLKGEYFADKAMTDLRLTRVDPTVDFTWTGAPATGVPADGFAVRWTGEIKPRYTETYTLRTATDDGVRVWIDGRLVIDDWNVHAEKITDARVALVANRRHAIKIEYFDNTGRATARLSWSSARQSREIVPSSRLFARSTIPGPFGLDTRPSNTTCLAPKRPDAAGIALEPALGDQSFSLPVALLQPTAGRFYVVEKGGTIKTSRAGAAATTFADLRSRINASPNEAGLLGVAFDPAFATSGRVYLSYTAPSASSPANLRSVIARAVSRDGGNTLDTSSIEELLSFDQPYDNHNGGHIAFGGDGYLYIGFGDGGSGGDPQGNGQNLRVLMGKVLRIDVSGNGNYRVPQDNPFVNNASARGEIYAYGVRNPWRFSFDRSTGDLWLGDVGQNKWEEIDKIVKGGNYGWRSREGAHCYVAGCSAQGMIDPVVEYSHDEGISVTGGFVYRGRAIPSLVGTYLYSDFGSGRLWGIAADNARPTPRVLAETGLNVASFAKDLDGEIYVLDYSRGKVRKVVAGGATTGGPAARLSQTGCVVATDPKKPASGLIPYDVNAPLWSDGADKERFLAIPNGTRIAIRADGDWDMPLGTVLVKTFSLAGKRIETRLFVRHDDGGWGGYTYEWNDAQTDASLLPGGKTKSVGGQTWTYPTRAQCMECHTGAAGGSLGLETAQLNRTITYPNGRVANQLATLDNVRLFETPLWSAPSAQAALPRYEDASALEADRARAYLHANCSFCHRPGAPGRGTADLRFATPFAQQGICNVAPSQGDLGVAGARLFTPGQPGTSVIPLRMRHQGDMRMPPVGTSLVDTRGVALVEGWIRGTTRCP